MASGYRTKPRIAVADGDPVVQMAPSAKFRRAPIPGGSQRRLTHPSRPGAHVLGIEIGADAIAYPIDFSNVWR